MGVDINTQLSDEALSIVEELRKYLNGYKDNIPYFQATPMNERLQSLGHSLTATIAGGLLGALIGTAATPVVGTIAGGLIGLVLGAADIFKIDNPVEQYEATRIPASHFFASSKEATFGYEKEAQISYNKKMAQVYDEIATLTLDHTDASVNLVKIFMDKNGELTEKLSQAQIDQAWAFYNTVLPSELHRKAYGQMVNYDSPYANAFELSEMYDNESGLRPNVEPKVTNQEVEEAKWAYMDNYGRSYLGLDSKEAEQGNSAYMDSYYHSLEKNEATEDVNTEPEVSTQLGDSGIPMLDALLGDLLSNVDLYSGIGQQIGELIQVGIGEAFLNGQPSEDGVSIVDAIIGGMTEQFETAMEDAPDMFLDLGTSIKDAITLGIVESMTLDSSGAESGQGGVSLVDAIIGGLTEQFETALEDAPETFLGLGTSIKDAIAFGITESLSLDSSDEEAVGMVKVAESIITSLKDSIESEDSTAMLGEAGKSMGINILSGVMKKMKMGSDSGKIQPSKVMIAIGDNIIKGLVTGLDKNAYKAYNKAKSIAEKIKEIIQSAYAINSPSKWAMGIGENINEGLAIGLENSVNLPINAVMSISSKVKDAWEDGQTSLLASQSIAYGSLSNGYSAKNQVVYNNQRPNTFAPTIQVDGGINSLEYRKEMDRLMRRQAAAI